MICHAAERGCCSVPSVLLQVQDRSGIQDHSCVHGRLHFGSWQGFAHCILPSGSSLCCQSGMLLSGSYLLAAAAMLLRECASPVSGLDVLVWNMRGVQRLSAQLKAGGERQWYGRQLMPVDTALQGASTCKCSTLCLPDCTVVTCHGWAATHFNFCNCCKNPDKTPPWQLAGAWSVAHELDR